MKLANEILLALAYVSRILDPDSVRARFIESLNELDHAYGFEYSDHLPLGVPEGRVFPIATMRSSFGCAVMAEYPKAGEAERSVFRNGFQFLAVLLENRQHERDLLSGYRSLQQELKQEKSMVRTVLNTMPVGVWVTDANGLILMGNVAGEEIWGGIRHVGPDQYGVYKAWWTDTGKPVAPEEWPVARVLITGGIVTGEEIQIESFDGLCKTLLVSAAPILNDEGLAVGAVTVNQDITQRKQAENLLRLAEDQLRQSQKMEAVGQLAGGIAHDFNNLLTAILGYSDMILSGREAQSAPLREDVEEIKHAAERAAALTQQILAFSRRQALKPELVGLNTVLTGMESLLRRTLGENVDLLTLLHPDLGQTEVDVHQFEQVLMNLAINARDAMPAGGRLTLETANVELGEEYCRANPDAQPGSYVMLSVSDNGCGMSEETMFHMFEPFFTTKPPGAGTGLGLSTVYGIVKQSGGSISVRSEPGRGTSFKIYLPRVAMDEAAETIVFREHISSLGNEIVMVVEDESSLRNLIERVLTTAGYTALCFGSADEAAAVLEQGQVGVDLLLTDVVLPGAMQGNDLVRRLQDSRPGLPVLYMSGYTREAIVHAGRLDEGVNFLEKPFTPDSLARMVRQVLDQARTAG